MKKSTKLFAIFAALCMVLTLACSAGANDDAVKAASLDYIKQISLDNESSAHQMRGFAVSRDGAYYYCGFLQQDRHVTKFDAKSGSRLAEYICEIEDERIADPYESYPKGIAADNRGLVFVGLTHPNTGYISIACLNDEMRPIGFLTEDIDGGDKGNTGINGIATRTAGDKILLYVLTGYNKDTIRCYDVTDVTDMKLYSEFGADGVIDYNELTGSTADPGYIAVDTEGYIYITYLKDGSGKKGSHVAKIAEDGKSIITQTEVKEAYGIATAGDYLFVTSHDGTDSQVTVIDKADMTVVSTVKCENQMYSMSGIGYGDGALYVGDHGDANARLSGCVLKASFELTQAPEETEKLEAPDLPPLDDLDPPVNDVTDKETDDGEGEPVPDDDDGKTTSENKDTAKADTNTTDDNKTDKDGANIGMYIGIGAAVVVVLAIVVFIVIRKKKK